MRPSRAFREKLGEIWRGATWLFNSLWFLVWLLVGGLSEKDYEELD